MVSVDSSVAFLAYMTLVSSSAAGVTELVKSVVPFLGTDYEAARDCPEDHYQAGRLSMYKKFCNLAISCASAGVIFGVLGLDPARILAGASDVEAADPWRERIWVWGIVAVFGSPFFHSLWKILEGVKENVNGSPAGKPRQKVSGRK